MPKSRNLPAFNKSQLGAIAEEREEELYDDESDEGQVEAGENTEGSEGFEDTSGKSGAAGSASAQGGPGGGGSLENLSSLFDGSSTQAVETNSSSTANTTNSFTTEAAELHGLALLKHKAQNLYTAVLEFIKHPFASLSDFGNGLVTSAQADLQEYKKDLEATWQLGEAEYKTTALYVTNLLGKVGYTVLSTCISSVSAAVKITIGGTAMLLGGDIINLGARLINTLKEVAIQGWDLLKNTLGNLCGQAWALICNLSNKVGNLVYEVAGICKDAAIGAWNIVRNIGRNIGSAASLFAKGLGYIGLGLLKFTGISLAGVALVTGLILETSIVTFLATFAKVIEILDEKIAEAAGTFLDCLYASGVSFRDAGAALVATEVPQPAPSIDLSVSSNPNLAPAIQEQIASTYNSLQEEEEEEVIQDAIAVENSNPKAAVVVAEIDWNYYRNRAVGYARRMNTAAANRGNSILTAYRDWRNSYLPGVPSVVDAVIVNPQPEVTEVNFDLTPIRNEESPRRSRSESEFSL